MRFWKDKKTGEFCLELNEPGHPIARHRSLSVIRRMADFAENNRGRHDSGTMDRTWEEIADGPDMERIHDPRSGGNECGNVRDDTVFA